MGTELVVYRQKSKLPKAVVERCRRETEQKTERVEIVGYIGVLAVCLFFLGLLAGYLGFANLAVFWAVAGFGGSLAVFARNDDGLNNIEGAGKGFAKVQLSCQHCNVDTNLSEPWKCGHCDHENRITVMGALTSAKGLNPFSTCQNTLCKKQASAYQCPHCARHVIIDLEEYEHLNAGQTSNFTGAARFVGDEKPPILTPEEQSGRLHLSSDEL